MPERHFILPNGLVGRDVSRGTSLPLNPTEGPGTLRGFYGGLPPRGVATIWLFVTFCAQKVKKSFCVLPKQFQTGGHQVCLTAIFARLAQGCGIGFSRI